MSRTLFGVAAAWLIAVAIAHAAPAATVQLPPDAGRIGIWGGLRVVVPANPSLTPDQAATFAAADDAMVVDSPERVFGRATSPYWARFSLNNPVAVEQSRVLVLESTTQFEVDLFQRDENDVWRRLSAVADAGHGRLGSGTTHPAWELLLAPHQTIELLLRLEGPAIVRFPLYIYKPASHAERERKSHILMGAALGVCLLIGVYIGSMRRYLDDASVPLFICMLVGDMVGALWLSGFLGEWFPAVPERLLSPIGFAGYAVLTGCGNLHARIYLDTAAWAPKADRLLQGLGAVALLLAPWFSVAFPVAARVVLVWGGAATAVVVVVISIMATRRKIPFSGFIAAAWLAYLIISSWFLVARVVDDPAFWSSSTLALVQVAVTSILFGLAMSQRLMRQRDTLLTARREAVMQNETAAALMRERGLFFATTTHDLRQPLVGVSLFADLLKDARTAGERREYADKLDLALKEVDCMLVGIQQLAAVREPSHRPALETVRLDDVLMPIVEEYRRRSENKRITIRYVPSRLSITTHVPYFQRIVRNVLSNAIRYTDRGDRILVGCRRGGGLRLVIADTGHGMTEEQARQAFDAFQRFDPAMSIPDGFGLGLFSTKSLAQALGMAVGLRSHKGRGTEFRLELASFAA